jgi:predicted CopG family antitoxin
VPLHRTTTGKIKTNISLDDEAWNLLTRMAPTRRAYGDFISELIKAEWDRRAGGTLPERVRKLEQELADLRASMVPPTKAGEP